MSKKNNKTEFLRALTALIATTVGLTGLIVLAAHVDRAVKTSDSALSARIDAIQAEEDDTQKRVLDLVTKENLAEMHVQELKVQIAQANKILSSGVESNPVNRVAGSKIAMPCDAARHEVKPKANVALSSQKSRSSARPAQIHLREQKSRPHKASGPVYPLIPGYPWPDKTRSIYTLQKEERGMKP